MRRNYLVVTMIGLAVVLLPALALAQINQPVFRNPLGPNATLVTVTQNIIRFILGLTAFLALLALLWGGVMFMTSFGDEEKIKSAKRIIFWSIAGVAVILLAFFITEQVTRILGR